MENSLSLSAEMREQQAFSFDARQRKTILPSPSHNLPINHNLVWVSFTKASTSNWPLAFCLWASNRPPDESPVWRQFSSNSFYEINLLNETRVRPCIWNMKPLTGVFAWLPPNFSHVNVGLFLSFLKLWSCRSDYHLLSEAGL